VTTHGLGYQPGDEVTVTIGGWTLDGVIQSVGPTSLRVRVEGCLQTLGPEQIEPRSDEAEEVDDAA
jgi:hypothetical protein